MQLSPDTDRLPVAQPSPACHARPTAHLLGEHLPGDAALQNKQDAGQRRPVWDRWPTAFRLRPLRRQQRFDQGPQFIRYKRIGHAAQNGLLLPPFPVSLGVLNRQMSEYSLGIDIGGTFTDLVIHDHDTGRRWGSKVLTTHADP